MCTIRVEKNERKEEKLHFDLTYYINRNEENYNQDRTDKFQEP